MLRILKREPSAILLAVQLAGVLLYAWLWATTPVSPDPTVARRVTQPPAQPPAASEG